MDTVTKNAKQWQNLKFQADGVFGLENIEIELFNSLSDSKGVIREMCSYLLNSGGKRIRPLLVLYSGLIFSGENKALLDAAVAAELIHMASLVHDDIIDNSNLRRNRPSINKAWGNHFAVLCGDYLFAKAFGILSTQMLQKSLNYMVQAIENMCTGEIIQANNRFKYDISLKKYYEIIARKTAVFLECCCKSGACLTDADDLQVKKIGEYGLNLGLAFQITDDILDLCGKANVLGKPVCEDISQGNITLPIILLLHDDRYGKRVREVIQSRQIDCSTINFILEALNKSNYIERSFQIAAEHIDKAKQSVRFLPQSCHTEFLITLADKLQTRIN